jgi:hypothetical protein
VGTNLGILVLYLLRPYFSVILSRSTDAQILNHSNNGQILCGKNLSQGGAHLGRFIQKGFTVLPLKVKSVEGPSNEM